MYIKRLRLKNIRCFDELEIDFEKPGSSILILGDNGDGKSTILKCLAMGLCDESSASALFRELPGEFVRRKPGEETVKKGSSATIEIDLAGKDGWTYRITTRIVSLETFERVTQSRKNKSLLCRFRGKKKELLTQDAFPWEQIFVSGYGAGIRVNGTADFQHYLAVDAVYPLFRYDVPLQNPELVIRRLVEAAMGIRRLPELKMQYAKRVLDTVKHLLAGFLDLKEDDQIVLTPTGIKVRGHWGIAELGELGDGYRATVTWVLDLLAWWFLRAERKARLQIADIEGIVLFDEIEQHLHPRWQRYVLSYFKRAFPKVQFIATTHSPLCAAGTADLGDDECQLINLTQSNGASKAIRIQSLSGLRADQILTSNAFNLPDTRNPLRIGEKVSRYRELALSSKLSQKEKKELNSLRKFINQNVPEAGQFEVERKLRGELRSLVEKIEGLRKKKRDR